MRYVLMIHRSEARLAELPKEKQEAITAAYGSFTKELFATGKAGDAAALEGVGTATTVRVRGGKRSVEDGPFAETREQLGGYYSFAGTEDEAIAWAAKVPDAQGGIVEVRPVIETEPPPPPATAAGKEFLLLIYEAEARWATMTEAERNETFGRYSAFSKGVKEKGAFVAGEQLDSMRKAKSVSVTGGQRVVRDGPFAETREQLGGYYRVKARDLDEAIAMAAQIPAAETGTIEVRPVRYMIASS
jgi:hypothetical protein